MKRKILLSIILGLIFTLSFGSVAFAADVEIISDTQSNAWRTTFDAGIYWVSNTTGYIFYREGSGTHINWCKTTNGGLTWSYAGEYDQVNVNYFDSWADWETPNDNGTKIHFVLNETAFSINYAYFDTATETWSDDVVVEAAVSAIGSDLEYCMISITKSRGNVLNIAYRHVLDAGNLYGFETSNDGGNTWVTKDNVWEAANDHLQLYPANLSDPDDIWAVFWDISTDELSLKTYDASGNSWNEDVISDNMTDDPDDYIQMDVDIRQSDGNLFVSAWSEFNSATGLLKCWNISNGSTITELTDVISNASNKFQTAIMLDQSTNDIYVAYLKGTIESSVGVYYQKSTDGGTTWSGEISFSDGTLDYRLLFLSGIKESLGGKFMPAFMDSDASEEIDTNYINSIFISSNVFSDPAIAPDYVIDCPTCTDNLTSSGNFTSNETFSGGPPGFAVIDDAAGESGAAPIWLWGWIGMFAIIVPGFFVTYMERKHGAGNGNLILRMGLALIVMGLLVTWGRFDWWMIVLYLFIAAAPAFMSRQYDIGGAGGVSQHGWIGFCATSWIGLTIINRILEGQFLTASESSWWCSIQLFNEFRVFDLFTVPVLNFQFFTVGIPSLLRWDYSFFGGNAELIQYFLYTITAVVAFILFCILIGLLFNAFRAR